MKRTFSFALICLLSATLCCACDPGDIDLFGEENTSGSLPEDTSGPSESFYCWKVIADNGDGLVTTEYWWDYESEVERIIKSREEADGTITYTYSKVEGQESIACSDH